MALLDRSAWYDLARTTNWTPQYITEAEMFPPEQSDPFGIPMSEWETYDEPFKVSYREYVQVQREKDASTYSVKAALLQSKYYETADPGYLSTLKWHYGTNALGEYAACFPAGRMVRFAKAPAMRNMATFFVLDELRHTQIELYFAHQLVSVDRQFDWAAQAHHTMNWAVLTGRHAGDDIMQTRDIASTSIMVNLSFETGFTNVQMIALSADAANIGDFTFSNLITSIQSDEARHAQIATPVIEIMVRNGHRAEAQRAADIGFWRMWRVYSLVSGIPMDYWIPLEKRDRSFKEYIHEFVAEQFERQLRDLGLDRPWYWDHFIADTDIHHHAQQIALWSWRKTLWWDPHAGVGRAERAWLEGKYPGWNARFGAFWDGVIDSLRGGRVDETYATAMPRLCNMCQYPIGGHVGAVHGPHLHQSEHDGRFFKFCGPVCKWIFDIDPSRYCDTQTIADRLGSGEIGQSMDELLSYMGIGVISEGGEDATRFGWLRDYGGVGVQ
ncbi:MAG TPA: toluene monooxygenase [Xanthobacteraceae bacterium]|nr:toluene monooxygenase [Xanthobacteraceae bacterium]